MGLDMYLRIKRYVPAYDHNDADDKAAYAALLSAIGLDRTDLDTDSPSAELTAIALYWRKANAIHAWFVRETQDGKDDCSESYVSRDQLAELQEICARVMERRELAEVLLPTTSGFFFGGTEYDDWYFKKVEYTRDGLARILANPKFTNGRGYTFYYSASW